VQSFLAVVATLASGAFAAAVLRQYLQRRRPYQLAWGISLALFMVASAALLAGDVWGWTPAGFKAYYLCGAILTAPWLGLGTVFLLARGRLSTGYLVALLAFTALSVALVLAAPLGHAGLAGTDVPEGRQLLPVAVRVLAVVGNVVGTVVVVGGAVASGLRLRHAPGQRARFQGTLLIAAGVALAASGGTFAFAGRSGGLALALALGACVMYAGFWRASQPDRARAPAAPAPAGPPSPPKGAAA
jgi:hypothetical protein